MPRLSLALKGFAFPPFFSTLHMIKPASALFFHSLAGSFLLHSSLSELITPGTISGSLGLSYYLLPLTWLVFQASILASNRQTKSLQLLWLIIVGATECLHYSVFLANSLFTFLVAYEAVLIPLQLLIAQ